MWTLALGLCWFGHRVGGKSYGMIDPHAVGRVFGLARRLGIGSAPRGRLLDGRDGVGAILSALLFLAQVLLASLPDGTCRTPLLLLSKRI
jgi:hypothetical protein